MTTLFILLQKSNIEEKLKNSPDSGYQIGVVIGSSIPFVLLVLVAYWMYYSAKKSDRKE